MTAAIKSSAYKLFAFGFIAILLTSCSTTKYLETDQKLYQKTEIKFTTPEKFSNKKKIKKDVLFITLPKPNNKIYLRFYNFMGVPNKEKGLWHWLGNKFGEPPVLFNDAKTNRSRLRIEQYLRSNGYFGTSVKIDTLSKGQRMQVSFHLAAKGEYQINSFQIPKDSNDIIRLFQKHQGETHIKKGHAYRLTDLRSERIRLTRLAQDHGYIQFSQDDLFFLADTTTGMRQIELYLYLREKENEESYKTFKIGKTFVHMNYNLRSSTKEDLHKMTASSGGLFFSNEKNILKESVIERLLPQRSGDLYNKTLQDVAYNRLQGLGLFKFVNIKYAKDSTIIQNKVNRYIYLTPGPMQDVTGTFELNNQTGNYYGTSAGLTYAHKNLFKGAERFNISLKGGLATQLNSNSSFINTSQLDLKFSFSTPKLIIPFKTRELKGSHIPRTLLSSGIGYENRVMFYTLQTGEFKFGYSWKTSNRGQHELYPVSFQMFKLIDSSPEFDEYRAQNLRLSRSFDNTMLAGLKYSYYYTNMTNLQQKKAIYFTGELETSGNLFYLISRLARDDHEESIKLFGLPVAQFFKISADVRHYTNYRKSTLVTRMYAGLGLAYGNLEELPYSRQFVIGGANGLRAFQLRGLGPGSFIRQNVGNQVIDEQFLDQTGNLKLEMNVEYRYPIFGFLKGAVFLDAGNVWLVNNMEIPEGNFKIDRFVDEIALGTGAGLRLDFNYFVIRLDASFALRQPVPDEGFRWVINEIDFLNSQWRKDNLKWHLAIGYPF